MKDRAQRNLLLVIDGKTTDETLLAKLAGITAADFDELAALGLIAPVARAGAAAAPIAAGRERAVPSTSTSAGYDYAPCAAPSAG